MVLFKNRYYHDYGLDYVFRRLAEEFRVRGIELVEAPSPIFGYYKTSDYFFDSANPPLSYHCEEATPTWQSMQSSTFEATQKDYVLKKVLEEKRAIFWDKDIRLAKAMESKGIRLFPNSALALENCDDKELTYAKLISSKVPLAKTISAPLVFDVNTIKDSLFLDFLEQELKYPIVVKENVGSQGKQVYLATNRQELEEINASNLHKPHVYQEFKGEFGSDIRVYVIGGEAVASAKRKNTTNFKSNVALGGDMELYPLDSELKNLANIVSKRLNLEYGSVDFVYDNGYIFIEANSNAYFKGIEGLGVQVGTMLADYIMNNSFAGVRSLTLTQLRNN